MKLFALCLACVLAVACVAQVSPQAGPVVLRSGAITLKVADFRAAREEATRIAEGNGGHIIGGRDEVTEKGKYHGWLKIVVPQAQLDATMHQLRGIGVVFGDASRDQSLSMDVADLSSRIARLREHRGKLNGLLQSSRRLRGSDILFVQDRLFRAAVAQDLLGHQRTQMVDSSGVSNISLFLFEPGSVVSHPPTPITFGDKVVYAFNSSWASFLKFVGHVGLFVASVTVYALIWAPCAMILLLLWRKVRPHVKWPKLPHPTLPS